MTGPINENSGDKSGDADCDSCEPITFQYLMEKFGAQEKHITLISDNIM